MGKYAAMFLSFFIGLESQAKQLLFVCLRHTKKKVNGLFKD